MFLGLVMGLQLFFSCVVGIYFLVQLRNQTSGKTNINKDSGIKYEKMKELRNVKLTEPLSEKVRPRYEEDIIGQKNAMKALKIALCGPNPQHIIIYGAPGVGKTAAARIALDIAKSSVGTPFKSNAKFIEVDATTLRFDERSIADPLMGSVHDPIYQGAGAYGPAGIPQPKMGAVTKAHGGVLFIDEIGELQEIQMNKLLKVLEDRKVILESSYYSEYDDNIPGYIHDIFRNGLPADFRLIGATTRMPDEIPPALRSRCTEIYFDELNVQDILKIVENVTRREKVGIENNASEIIGNYACNGRDAVSILQTAYSLASSEGRMSINNKDVEWVIQAGHYSPRHIVRVDNNSSIGKVNAIGVMGNGKGTILELEAVTDKIDINKSRIKVTGIVEEEEIHSRQRVIKRKSMAFNSVENVLTVLKMRYNIDTSDYMIHVNFPSGIPVDGPSAGCAILVVLYSAILNKVIPGDIAITGEISIKGKICPVGGVYEKIQAAKEAGVKKVFVPKDNMKEMFKNIDIEVIPVEDINDIVKHIFGELIIDEANKTLHA